MKLLYLSILFSFLPVMANSQEVAKAEVYLLTCGPGTEIYSVYGHSALRIIIPEKNSDIVYNWGVFDFSTPNFAWRFARGRLDYSLGVSSYESFLREYYMGKRWVVSQKINLDSAQTAKLFVLLEENLKPENINYRYDFFYDDCSTRIRDLLEKSLGDDLDYPPDASANELPTFRDLISKYEKGYVWRRAGIDLLIGTGGDKKASFRDRMFLPVEMKDGLSQTNIRREGKMIPLLTNPALVLDFESLVVKPNMLAGPFFIFGLLLIICIGLTGYFRGKKANNIIDIVVFSVFSILSVLMIFFNLFTDHQQLKSNLNIIWLSPFVILCLLSLVLKKDWRIWFRMVFFLSVGFLAFLVFLPQDINNSFVPLIGILIVRSSVRSEFSWNPLTIPYLTQL
jgi:hypothetical protein